MKNRDRPGRVLSPDEVRQFRQTHFGAQTDVDPETGKPSEPHAEPHRVFPHALGAANTHQPRVFRDEKSETPMANKIEPRPDFDFDNALERVREDPVAAADELRAASTGERLGNELTGRQHIATGCEIFQSLQRGDEQERARFFEKLKEAGIKHKPRKNGELTLVLLYVMPDASYTTCSKAAAAAQWLMDHGAQPKDMPARIEAEEGGIEALYNQAKGAKKEKPKNSASQATPTASVTESAGAGTSDSEVEDAGEDGNDKGTVGTEDAGQGNEKKSAEQNDVERSPRVSVSKKDIDNLMKLVRDILERGLLPLIIAVTPDLARSALGTRKNECFLLDTESEGTTPDGLLSLFGFEIVMFHSKKPKKE